MKINRKRQNAIIMFGNLFIRRSDASSFLSFCFYWKHCKDMKSTITDNDIMVDGLAEEVFPYLDELFEYYGWSLLTVASRLVCEDYSLPINLSETLVESWEIHKEKHCNILD